MDSKAKPVGRLPVDVALEGYTLRFRSARGGELKTFLNPLTNMTSIAFVADRLADTETLRVDIVPKKVPRRRYQRRGK